MLSRSKHRQAPVVSTPDRGTLPSRLDPTKAEPFPLCGCLHDSLGYQNQACARLKSDDAGFVRGEGEQSERQSGGAKLRNLRDVCYQAWRVPSVEITNR